MLDFTSGQMCATLGHGHPAILDAMRDAGGRAVHLFSGFLSSDVTELARELMALLPEPLSRAMFLSTGGEANEAALRLAKLATGGHEVLAFAGSWHGMTAGAASSTYSAGRRGYGPALPGTMALPTPNPYRCPIAHCRDRCDLTCLDTGLALTDAQSVGAPAAAIVEPILSAGGIVPLPDGYLAGLKQRCEERGMLLVVDEAQTALGRVGTMFAFEQHDVVPDFVALSKTLGGGLPLSATITSDAIEADAFEKGFLHVTSHVSDPLPAAVAAPSCARCWRRTWAPARSPWARACARARGAPAPPRADRRRARRRADARRRSRLRPRDARARRGLRQRGDRALPRAGPEREHRQVRRPGAACCGSPRRSRSPPRTSISASRSSTARSPTAGRSVRRTKPTREPHVRHRRSDRHRP